MARGGIKGHTKLGMALVGWSEIPNVYGLWFWRNQCETNALSYPIGCRLFEVTLILLVTVFNTARVGKGSLGRVSLDVTEGGTV